MRNIYLAPLLPSLDSSRRDAKAAFKIFGALGQRTANFSHSRSRHCVNMTAFQRDLTLAVCNRFTQTRFNLQAQFRSLSHWQFLDQCAEQSCRRALFVGLGVCDEQIDDLIVQHHIKNRPPTTALAATPIAKADFATAIGSPDNSPSLRRSGYRIFHRDGARLLSAHEAMELVPAQLLTEKQFANP